MASGAHKAFDESGLGGFIRASPSQAQLFQDESERVLLKQLRRQTSPVLEAVDASGAREVPELSLATGLGAGTLTGPLGPIDLGGAAAAAALAASAVGEGGRGGGRARSAGDAAGLAAFASSAAVARQCMSSVVDDSFNRCFESNAPVPWNWNVYLWPAYYAGVVVRYSVLFPLRLTALVLGFVVTFLGFLLIKAFGSFPCCNRRAWERSLIQFLCSAFVLSWSGVIRFHGVRPTARRGEVPGVFVANHSSMIDFIVLQQSHCYAVVGQKHPGWVGFIQDYVLSCLQCIWFDRAETDNRAVVAQRFKEHAHDPTRLPLLVFPEGTCVNNEHVLQFKKSVFELGVPVNPIAIRYNKVFVDGYWNSRAQSFAGHLVRLMTSWAVVCDVHYMDPVSIRDGESSVDFARRVQRRIAHKIGLKPMDWDGYMKYWKPSDRFIASRRRAVAEDLLDALNMGLPEGAGYKPETKEGAAGGGGAVSGGATPVATTMATATATTATATTTATGTSGLPPLIPRGVVLGSPAGMGSPRTVLGTVTESSTATTTSDAGVRQRRPAQ